MLQRPKRIASALARACAGIAMLMTVAGTLAPAPSMAQTVHQSVTGTLEKLEIRAMRCGPGSGWYVVFVKAADGATDELQLPFQAIGEQELSKLLNTTITVQFDANRNILTLHHSGTAVVDYDRPGTSPSACSGTGRG